MNRREFIGSVLAAGALPSVGDVRKTSAADLGAERLRIGVLSDIHIKGTQAQPYFEKTLRTLDAWKADGVMACGDLADYGLRQQLELVAKTWFGVFPGGKGSDGRPVANLMHYGDHDMATNYADKPDAKATWPDDAFRRGGIIFTGGRKRIWEDCFHEPWAPIVLREVKGYPFVLAHFTKGEKGNERGQNVPGLEDFFAAHRFDPGKPIFFSQHRIPLGTACNVTSPGLEDGKTTALFSKYPNLVALTGHYHISGTNELNIWQGAFTSIHVPSLRYCCTMPGRENSYACSERPPRVPVYPSRMMPEHPSHKTHQGYFMTVFERGLVIRRWDFEYDLSLGPDWVVPFAANALPPDEKPFSPAQRARTLPVPEFAPGAKIALGETKGKDRAGNRHDMVQVSFPPVNGLDGRSPRANDYEVTAILRQGDVERVLCQKRVFSPRYLFGDKMDTEPVVCLFSKEEIPDGWPIRYEVRPVNACGRKGAPIGTAFEKSGTKHKEVKT